MHLIIFYSPECIHGTPGSHFTWNTAVSWVGRGNVKGSRKNTRPDSRKNDTFTAVVRPCGQRQWPDDWLFLFSIATAQLAKRSDHDIISMVAEPFLLKT